VQGKGNPLKCGSVGLSERKSELDEEDACVPSPDVIDEHERFPFSSKASPTLYLFHKAFSFV
jgi:hypothetical protein